MINIERVISKTPMVIADYFTEDGLLKQVGLVKEYWNRIVVKELTDNALDAIEPLQDKKVFMDVTSGSLGIYDNGTGIKKETVEDIYDFENYVSQNRNYITASRGKQGNGLKTIISICYIQGYRLLWHTAEGIILEANIDSEQLRYGRLEVSFVEIGVTDKRGIEIIGIGAVENFLYDYFIGYSKCNPDVSFYLNYFGEKIENLAKMEGIDKSKNISIAYYDYDSYQNFIIHTQDGNTTYKQFLDNVFGTRMKNKSNIKSKIKDIDFKSDEFIKDFLMLKEDQQTKKAFMDVLERDKYPLFYDMTKAESAQITNNAVMNCLISSFQNENIGFVSNAITKIFNSEGDPDTKLVRVLCAYNNFVIDYFKTQKSMDLQQYTFIYEEYKDSDKHKCPHFFMYAKDKKQKQCEKSNLNGNADRISKYISDKTSNGIAKVNYSSKDAFNPEMLKNSDIKVDRTSEKYSQLRRLLLDLKREHSAWYKKVKDDLNAKESEKQLFNIYCGAKVKEIFPDRKEAANYLVDIEYHTEENQEEKKDILWNCYGDILYDNLCKNVDSDITPKVKRNVYQKSVDREKEILESRDRIKKEQEEIVKVLITKTVYDDLMGIKVRKGCEKDRYILYILYVLIRRFQAKYGEEKEYIRIYKGLRQKSKITAATIDNWIDSKCTQKGLDRLEKNKYIRREHMQNYDKVYLRELPETDVSDIVFDAESNNPLLDLWEYNGERKVAKCEICNKKFVVVGNTKTCSDKCSKVLVKRNKNKTS